MSGTDRVIWTVIVAAIFIGMVAIMLRMLGLI